MTTQHENTPAVEPQDEDEISLIDLLIVLLKNKVTLILWPLVAGVLAIGATLTMTVTYQATTRVMPPQQQQSSASMLASQLGALAGLAGGGGGLLKNPNDVYLAMLKSNSIVDRMGERFNLQSVYESKFKDDMRKGLIANTSAVAGKDGLIVIEVVDEDPKRAADMANAYVEELVALTKRLAITEAQQRRAFFERQLKSAKDNLANAEIELKKTQSKGGVGRPDDQAKVLVESAARLKALIAAKEVQIGAMRTAMTEQNPQYRMAMEELTGLKGQLSKLHGVGADGDLIPGAGRIAESGLEYLRKFRDFKYHETMFEVLAKQYEAARIDESSEGAVIQVVDVAQPPERKHKPKRAIIVMMTVIATFFAALVWVFVRHAFRTAAADPAKAARLLELKRAAAFR